MKIFTTQINLPFFPACPRDFSEYANVNSREFSNKNNVAEGKIHTDFFVGTTVKYTCNGGFVAANDGESTCTEKDGWQPPVECTEPLK